MTTDNNERDAPVSAVQAIDVWFSQRRGAWIVERLDADGNQIGAAHRCEQEADVAACVAQWLRDHATIDLVAPYGSAYEEPKPRIRTPGRRAA